MDEVEDEVEYDTWLDTYEHSERLVHASLPENIGDRWLHEKLLDDQNGGASVERSSYQGGTKTISSQELVARNFEFFAERHDRWADSFIDQAEAFGASSEKLQAFVEGFATDWVDGMARRQKTALMRGVKASIRDLDRQRYGKSAGTWTLKPVADNETAFFTVEEMDAIFRANATLTQEYLTDYVDAFDHPWTTTTSDLTVRRGVYLLEIPEKRHELFELASYSLALGAVEKFAQTHTPKTKGKGIAAVFSAPLPAVQDRIVAFAPFIRGMTLDQLELVVAPPVRDTPLVRRGDFSGIVDMAFDVEVGFDDDGG